MTKRNQTTSAAYKMGQKDASRRKGYGHPFAIGSDLSAAYTKGYNEVVAGR